MTTRPMATRSATARLHYGVELAPALGSRLQPTGCPDVGAAMFTGGRKSDRVRHQIDADVGGAAEGYGSVPFHRTEWTAERIRATFVVDVQLLRSYGLPQPATELLETLAQWEIRSFLDGGLRLR